MKKILIIGLALVTSMSYAQDTDVDDNINQYSGTTVEVKSNLAFLVLGVAEAAVEVSLNQNSSVGLSGAIPFGDEAKETIDYLIMPYYRYYFGENIDQRFFIEGFGLFNSVEKDIPFADNDRFSEDLAIGAALGGKWVFKDHIVVGVNFGLGVNLLNPDEHDFETVSKGAVYLGYRF